MKNVKNSIFLKYHLLHQDNFLAHLLCHVPYFTYFNKWSDPDIKLGIYDYLLHTQDNPKKIRYPPVSNNFIYFSSIINIKIGYLKLGVGFFNSPYKTIYFSQKGKLCFFF